jgi:uncharacterized protein YlxW (UPF0749 family)
MATLVPIPIATQIMIAMASRVAMLDRMSVANLHRDRDWKHNGHVDQQTEQELAEVSAIAKRVVQRRQANERDEAEIKRRLPGLRAQGIGPADLERAISSVFVQGTISRWTKDDAPQG